MTFPIASLRLLLGSFVLVGLSAGLQGQDLPQTLSEQDLLRLNQQFLDSVVVVAGDQIITRTDLVQYLGGKTWQKRYRDATKLPPAEKDRAQTKLENDATAELVKLFLEVRAGQDRGFDPEVVASLVDRRFARQQELVGGYQALHRQLKAGGSSAEQFKESFRRSLYRHAWQGAITGKQIGTTGRKELNRYVRPGEIWGTYRTFLKSPRLHEVEMTGFREAQYEILELALGFKALGGREAALERANALQEQMTTGVVTFEELITYWSKTDEKLREKSTATFSLGQAARVSQSEFGGDALVQFLTQSEIGEISQPLESQVGVHLFLLTKVEPEVPSKPFADLEVQAAIRKHLADKQDRIRLGRAHVRLIKESQLHPVELAQYMLFQTQESMDQ